MAGCVYLRDDECPNEPRIAISTRRPTRGDLRSVIHWNHEDGPKVASRYCAEHARAILSELAVLAGPA
jgi:hypothetical protein